MPSDLPFPPGLFFVVATMLPVASFVFLLLWGGLRWALWPHAKDGGPAASLYAALGGDTGGRAPAYVATAAIAIACALCITGFVFFLADDHAYEAAELKLHQNIAVFQGMAKAAQITNAEAEHR